MYNDGWCLSLSQPSGSRTAAVEHIGLGGALVKSPVNAQNVFTLGQYGSCEKGVSHMIFTLADDGSGFQLLKSMLAHAFQCGIQSYSSADI